MNSTKCYLWRTFLLTGMVAAMTLTAAAQNNCLQDEYTANGGTQTLGCTANDVQVARVLPSSVNVIDTATGQPTGSNTCYAGSTFSFIADFEIVTTSKQSRSNIGIYFGTGTSASQVGALSGTCTDSIIAPSHTCQTTGTNPYTYTCGSDNYHELDPSPDNCGDTSSSDSSMAFGAGAQGVVLQVNNVTCPSSGSSLVIPVCTSWQVPGKTLQCVSPPPAAGGYNGYPYEPAAIPGSPSKCSCVNLPIPIQSINPAVTVAKSCSTGLTENPDHDKTVQCDAGPEGSTVTYTVKITNDTPSGQGGIIVDKICDNRYGAIYETGDNKCTAGTLGSIVSTTCTSANLGTITTSASCTFEAKQGENATVVNTVTVSGHSSMLASQTFGPTASNSVTVTSSDAPSTATTNKSVASQPVQSCVTVRFTANVANTGSADETLTLGPTGTYGAEGYVPALNDSYFGDVSRLQGDTHTDGSVVGTTCGVAGSATGLGTLAGVTVKDCQGGTVPGCNGGAYSQTLAPGTGAAPTSDGGYYKCLFDGVICGSPSEITNVCSYGLTNTNHVTANLTADESADKVTQTEDDLTANVCLSVQ